DFYAYLLAKGRTQAHADLVKARCLRVIELAGLRRISDVTLSAVQSALKLIRDGDKDKGASLRTIRHYTRQFKGFSRWLWRDSRVREDALAHLTSLNPDSDRRHERRALTPDELCRLIEAAERGGVLFHLTGLDRAMLYRVAALTGFRRNELRSLTP